MDLRAYFDRLAQNCLLGQLTVDPQPVSGGYMHQMYRLDTTGGRYAVKLLNPEVMSRPTAMDNYRRAEALEAVLEQNGLSIVPALAFGGRKMQCIDGRYCYVFTWVEHTALGWREIEPAHCAVMGDLLARMHSLPIPTGKGAPQFDPVQPEAMTIDWAALARKAETTCPEIAPALLEQLPVLEAAQTVYNRAVEALPPLCSICNADMDCKNVLWKNSQPLVIDLECLETGNPVNDLIQLSLSWAGGAVCRIDYGCLRTFLSAYRQRKELPPVDWRCVTGLGFSWLDWLSYSLRRAFGETGGDSAERQTGLAQAVETLERIRYFVSVQEEVAAMIETVMG
ncbi:MAG: phosphotransferase [Clostridia bacterium]|nr:phosphotransferase [Clostridia bacterium]